MNSMSQEMVKKEYGVCVDKHFDLARSKKACGKSLLVKIETEGPLQLLHCDATAKSQPIWSLDFVWNGLL